MKATRVLAWCGISAPVLRLGLILVLGALQADYSQRRDFISTLGAQGAPFAAVMNYVGTSLVGALLALFSVALYHATRPGPLVLAGTALLAISGLAFIAVGMFPCDPGCSFVAPSMRMRMHMLAGLIAMATQTLAPLALGLGLRARRGSRRYAVVSLSFGLIALIGLVLMATVGPRTHTQGLFQKAEAVATDLWLLVSALYVRRQSLAAA